MDYPSEYAQQLASAIAELLPAWLERLVIDTAVRLTGGCAESLRDDAARMTHDAVPVVIDEMDMLLTTDVDAQRSNPLSVLRRAIRFPTAVLIAHGIPQARRDEFARRAFPDDVYALSPATWSDIDEALAEPGIVWGAWKAKTVLDRRRSVDTPHDGRGVSE